MFHPDLRSLFRNWTTEELFYCQRILTTRIRRQDHFLWGFKSKILIWLRNDEGDAVNPLSLSQLEALRAYWLTDYQDFLVKHQLEKSIRELVEHYAG